MPPLYARRRVKRAPRRPTQRRKERAKPLRDRAVGRTKAPMRDLVFLAVTVGFFALAALVVAACDRIVGPDPDLTVGDRPTRSGAGDR